jgi:aminoglycoside phosphotransferase (APT) family kinase protein
VDPRQVLEQDFPDLRVLALERLGEGWDHVAFLVNGAFVFRLPWYMVEPSGRRRDAALARAEVALLEAVAGRLPVAVPEPVYVPDHCQYFGYRFLTGRSMEELLADDARIPGPDGQFADLVVEVITAIDAAVPVNDAAGIGVRRAGAPRCPDIQEQDRLRGRLTGSMQSASEWVVGAVPRLWTAAMDRPVATLHADLGLDHWLMNDGRASYALIDWSDCCIGPQEVQLSTLMWHAPELAANVARRYVQRTNRVVDGDLIFGCGYANALSDLGELLGEDVRDEEDIEWSLEFLHRWSQPDLAATLRGVRFKQ